MEETPGFTLSGIVTEPQNYIKHAKYLDTACETMDFYSWDLCHEKVVKGPDYRALLEKVIQDTEVSLAFAPDLSQWLLSHLLVSADSVVVYSTLRWCRFALQYVCINAAMLALEMLMSKQPSWYNVTFASTGPLGGMCSGLISCRSGFCAGAFRSVPTWISQPQGRAWSHEVSDLRARHVAVTH